MASIIGPRLAADLIFPVGGMDATRILNFQNRNGLTPEQIVAKAAGAIGGANEAVMARWGGVSYITEDTFARYRAGVGGTARKTPKKTESTQTDPVQGILSGHMLPIQDYEDALMWDWQYLRDAYEAQIDTDVQEVADAFRYRCEVDFLNRIMSNAENAIGGGYDVPWAIGTGTNVNFIPPPYQAYQFTSSHTHFVPNSGSDAAARLTVLTTMIQELRHHGISGTLALFVSVNDVANWAAVTGFVEINPQNIQVVTGGSAAVRFVTGELNGVPGELFGFFKTNFGVVEVRYLEIMPTNYCWMTRPYGENNVNNGIALRVHPTQPFGMAPDVQVTSSVMPQLKGINLKATHGVGVNRRVNGVAGMVGNATYSWTNL